MKKASSIILAICLLLALVPFGLFNVTVSAATRNEAVAWLRAQDGAWYNLDGAYGAQCSDFASAYMNWLVTGNPHGGVYGVYNANYYPTVAGWDTTKWEVISNYYDFVPQPGDIFVTVGADPNYGHVGVVISSNINTATIIDQNYVNWNLENGSKAVIHEIYWSGSYSPTYFIRFKKFSSASLATPTISFNKSSYTLGETITVSWQASPTGSNLSHYWISILDPNGKEIVGKGLGDSTTSYNFTPSVVGTYSVKIYATPIGSQSGEGSLTDTKSVTIHSPHTHSYGSWKVRNAATCTANGTDYRTCSCGAEETRTTTALGHNYTSVKTKPTCTRGGYTTFNCINCGDSYTDNEVSALGHTEGEWVTFGDGSQEQRCTVCAVLLGTKPAPGSGPAPETQYSLGDVNKDSKIDQFDYILVKRHYFATRLLTDDEMTRADVNMDGKIDQFDYILIKRHFFCTFVIG